MTRIALHAALVLCVLTAGCGFLGSETVREPRAESALDAAGDALAESETYRYDADARVVATGDGETESVEARTAGSVNATERRMFSRTNASERSVESYLVNRTRYQQCPSPGWDWGVQKYDADDWSTLTPAARQLSLLDSGSLYWNGTTTVDGRNATLLVGDVTTEALTEFQERRSDSLVGGPNVEDARLELWLDAESDRPIRTRLRFRVSNRGATATATMTTRFRAYGDPVTAEPPADVPTDRSEFPCPD